MELPIAHLTGFLDHRDQIGKLVRAQLDHCGPLIGVGRQKPAPLLISKAPQGASTKGRDQYRDSHLNASEPPSFLGPVYYRWSGNRISFLPPASMRHGRRDNPASGRQSYSFRSPDNSSRLSEIRAARGFATPAASNTEDLKYSLDREASSGNGRPRRWEFHVLKYRTQRVRWPVSNTLAEISDASWGR